MLKAAHPTHPVSLTISVKPHIESVRWSHFVGLYREGPVCFHPCIRWHFTHRPTCHRYDLFDFLRLTLYIITLGSRIFHTYLSAGANGPCITHFIIAWSPINETPLDGFCLPWHFRLPHISSGWNSHFHMCPANALTCFRSPIRLYWCFRIPWHFRRAAYIIGWKLAFGLHT